MTQEDYVSFETAKLLKEKGFDWEVHRSYLVNDNCFAPADVNDLPYRKDAIRIPTLQMAIKWLKEKYHIHADPIKQGNYNDCSEYYTWIVARMGIIYRNPTVADKLYYEEACEAAIKYCLENLI